MSFKIAIAPAADLAPAAFYAPSPRAKRRIAEFFTTQINNDHTRKAYNASRRFAAWCEAHGLRELSSVEPIHIAVLSKLWRRTSPPRRSMSFLTRDRHHGLHEERRPP